MKKYLIKSSKLILFLLISFASQAKQLGYSPLVYGSGKVQKDNLQIPAINNVEVKGIAQLHIQQASRCELNIQAEDNILPILQHEVRNSTLYIGLKSTAVHPQHPIIYTLKVKNLFSLKAFDNTTIICQDGLKLDTLAISLFNNAFANIWFNGNKLVAHISNSGNLIIGGFAKQQYITINETGSFDGKQLRGSKGTLAINYSGNGTVNIQDELAISMPERGEARYLGKPIITQNTSKHAVVNNL